MDGPLCDFVLGECDFSEEEFQRISQVLLDTDSLTTASQNTSRFAEPIKDSELQDKWNAAIPQITRRQN